MKINFLLNTTSKNQNLKCLSFATLVLLITLLAGCKIYSFKDVSIDYNKYKTVKINFIENKARFVNPQLSPSLTDKLQQKILNQTRLTRTNNDDAHYQISGFITDYNVTTSGVSSQQSATNRLTIAIHIYLKNTVENKTDEFDISRGFDFDANKSIEQAYNSMKDEIIKNLSDEIFNKCFSGW